MASFVMTMKVRKKRSRVVGPKASLKSHGPTQRKQTRKSQKFLSLTVVPLRTSVPKERQQPRV